MVWSALKYGMVGPQVWYGWTTSMVWLAYQYGLVALKDGMTCPRIWADLPLNSGRPIHDRKSLRKQVMEYGRRAGAGKAG